MQMTLRRNLIFCRFAAVYLCAGLENLLEEILLQCLPSDSDVTLTATLLEHAIANNGDLWGLLQPYAHLNAGRIASGTFYDTHNETVNVLFLFRCFISATLGFGIFCWLWKRFWKRLWSSRTFSDDDVRRFTY